MGDSPILIVGMSRSGTTLVSHILGSLPNVHIEIEPHALWKTGNFKYLNDEEFDITDDIVTRIRNKFAERLNKGQTFIEKSPINALRPDMVHAVFPEAKIVYIERDPVRCIYSNYTRSLSKDSFKLSIILKKYFVYSGSKDLAGAIGTRKLFDQIAVWDIPQFLLYTAKMFYLRQIKGVLPFGPKIKNFADLADDIGLLAYHVKVYKAAQKYKERYFHLYGDNLQVFNMESIMEDKNEIKKMVEFIKKPFDDEWAIELMKTFNEERVKLSAQKASIDNEILKFLNS